MLLWIGIIIGVVGIDQLTKWLAISHLKPIDTFPIIKDVIHLTYVENTGAAFGMLKNHRWIFMVISTIAIIGMIIFLIKYKPRPPLLTVAIAFIIGGGIGNMIDRVVLGYVVDFVYFVLIDFAVFNVADSFVSVGAVLMLIYVIFFEIKGKKNDTTTE